MVSSMSYAFPGDIWLTLALQQLGEWATPVMEIFTWLGYPQAYMIIVAVIYWSVDRKMGIRMALFLPLVASVNSILKQAFHAPRPFWMDSRIRAIRVSNGFGMPSGHAQAATLWIYVGFYVKNRWFWTIAILTTLLIGLSRIYLGVHFPSQVVAGWTMGIILALLFVRCETALLTWFLDRRLAGQLFVIAGISFLLLLLGGIFVWALRGWELPLEWFTNASDDLAGKGETIRSSIGMASVAGNVGGFLGAALGAVLSHRRGGFDPRGTPWKRLARGVAGLVLMMALYGIFQAIAPEEGREPLHSIWRLSGFFVISFSAILLIPVLFIRLRLLSSAKGSDIRKN